MSFFSIVKEFIRRIILFVWVALLSTALLILCLGIITVVLGLCLVLVTLAIALALASVLVTGKSNGLALLLETKLMIPTRRNDSSNQSKRT
jgi:uncharacterized membrane-anchored protein